ncbi:MAG: general secretion pathway protein GspM [Betaproteobacteria bacterium RBG_16_56_24]|nr:MAG: general secretion pathway protein GspM [Betaproteobacteria bacterium RBG_16_56_24]
MNLSGLINQYRQSFSAFLAARDARERALLSAAAVAVLLGLYYALLIGPALAGREHLNRNLPVLRQQAAQLQALSKEAAALSGKTAAPPIAMSKEIIEAALTRNGLKPQSVTLTGDFAKVQFAAVSFSGTLDWLEDMQRTAMLSVADANIVALTIPDTVDATISLRQQRKD